MKILIPAGTTSKTVKIFIADTSRTDGGGLTGLVFGTSNLTWYYIKEGDGISTQVTLATATLGTWATGGFIVVDATNMPGHYEISIPNAAIGTKNCVMVLRGATNMKQVNIEIQVDNAPANLQQILGTASQGAAGYVAQDSGQLLPTNPVANTYGEAAFIADILGGRFGTAQAGGNTTITLDAGASSDSTSYVGYDVFLSGGTGGGVRGVGQNRKIVAYNGSTKVATIDRAWGTNPDNTTKFMLLTGYIGVDWSKITNPTTTTALSSTTIGTVTNLTNAPTAGDFTTTMKTSLNAATVTLSAFGFTVNTNANSTETAIKAKTDNLPASPADESLIIAATNALSTQIGALPTPLTAATTRSALGMASANMDTQLGGIITAVDALNTGGGTGAYLVTITVNDGNGHLIQNAVVNLVMNSSVYSDTTNSSGIALLSPNQGNGTYSVRIIADNYQFTPVDLVVSGDTPHTYSMTANSFTPSAPDGVTGIGYTTETNGTTIVAGVVVTIAMTKLPNTTVGIIVDPRPESVTSDINGYFQFTGLVEGATYSYTTDRTPTNAQAASFLAGVDGFSIKGAIR